MAKPIAVLISDIHFTPATLELATISLQRAMQMAIDLDLPLVVAGDTLDSKAIIRGECANRLISIFEAEWGTGRIPDETYVMVGNHDLLNEKGTAHSLNFLRPHCRVIDTWGYAEQLGAYLVPYQNDPNALRAILANIKTDGHTRIIAHQGVQTAFMGHYVVDKTSLPPEAFADFRVISGHYHRAQDIKCGRPRKGAVGLFSYIGTPYTTSFAEANDGPKGFQILFDNGILEQVPLDLRRHIIVERTLDNLYDKVPTTNKADIIWLKVTGPYAELEKLKKREIGEKLLGHSNFKFDKIYTDSAKVDSGVVESHTDEQVLDAVIDGTPESDEQKRYLKALWREVLS